MFSALFHNVLYVPMYNLLVFLVDVVPGGDVGVAVILATVIVKVILMPLSLRAVHTQRRMKLIEPQVKELKEKHKDDKEKQAKEMLALYREHGVRPFSTFLGALIQLPIIIALYLVFKRGIVFHIDPSLLYSFVALPEHVSALFLGIFTVTGKSIVLAVTAAVAQFVFARVSIPLPKIEKGVTPTTAEDFGRMMAIQARLVLPAIIGIASYVTGGAVALYFITSSLVGLAQEFVVRQMKHPTPLP